MKKLRWIWVTLVPTVWLVIVTMTASYQKIFDPSSRLGFLANAKDLARQITEGKIAAANMAGTQRLIFNLRLDAAVTAIFALMVLVLVVEAIFQWYSILSRRRESVLHESPYIATRWAPNFSGAGHGTAVGDAIGDD